MTVTETTNPTIIDGDVVITVEHIGPTRARQLLDTYDPTFRKFRPSYAEGLSRDMVAGNWIFNGDPIRISRNQLTDGQHRMWAVEHSNTTQRFVIIYELPEAVYDTLDKGLSRNFGDSLRRLGFNNVSMRTALVKIIDRWNNGLSLGDTKRRTDAELDTIHRANMESINWSIANAMTTTYKIHIPPAMVAFAWWVLGGIDSAQAKTFLVGVAEGENLSKGNPIYTLRERLRNDAEERYTRNEYAHLIFQAWNAFREGRKLERCAFPSGIVSRDNMAVPR